MKSRGGRLLYSHSKDGRFGTPVITVKPGDDERAAAASAILEMSGFNIPPEAFTKGGIDPEGGQRILIADAKAGRQSGKPSGPVLWLKTAAQEPTMIASLIKAAADPVAAAATAAEAGEKAQEASKISDFMNKAKSGVMDMAGKAKSSWEGASPGQKAALVAGGLLAGGATFAAMRKKKKTRADGTEVESGSNLLAVPAALIAAAGGAYAASKGLSAYQAMKDDKAPTSAAQPKTPDTAAAAAAAPKPADRDAAKAYLSEHGTSVIDRAKASLKYGPLDAHKAREALQTEAGAAKRTAFESGLKSYVIDHPIDAGSAIMAEAKRLRDSGDVGDAATDMLKRRAGIAGGRGAIRSAFKYGPLDTIRGMRELSSVSGDNPNYARAIALGARSKGFGLVD